MLAHILELKLLLCSNIIYYEILFIYNIYNFILSWIKINV